MALITRQNKGDLLTHTELDGNFTHLDGKIGDLTTLTTTEKGTIVGAINELDVGLNLGTTQDSIVFTYRIGDTENPVSSHRHDLIIRETDYLSLVNGSNITLTTDTVSGHTHDVEFTYNAETYSIVVVNITSNTIDSHECVLVSGQTPTIFVDGVTGTVGLVRITGENDTKTGYRLDRDILAYKGVIGFEAVDLSYSETVSSTLGATGDLATAMGFHTIASGECSTSMGIFSTASGTHSTAMGNNTTASGDFSTAMGRNTTASGYISTAIGYTTTASDSYSTAMGRNTTASGYISTAMGQNTRASGTHSTAMGNNTTASGNYSTAMGHTTRASASYSTAMGYNTTASGVVSVSMGQYSQTSQDGCLGIGYEDFSVGYNPATKTDQNLKILLNGATGDGYFDGSADLGNADYAEYFEWVDGNPDNEDRRGFTVSLVGEKIKVAEENEVVIGVISAAPAIVGDSASLRWANKYELDEFGAKIMISYTMTEWTETIVETIGEGEDVREYTREENHSYHSDFIPEDLVVPSDAIIRSTDSNGKPLMGAKLNPNWDSSSEYIPRSDRKEWSPVGLLGKLYTRKDQVVGSNWIKLSDVNENIVRYLVR